MYVHYGLRGESGTEVEPMCSMARAASPSAAWILASSWRNSGPGGIVARNDDGRRLSLSHEDFSDTHVGAVLDQFGRCLETLSVPATATGYATLLAWTEGFGTLDRIGIEGTGSYGAGLVRFLRETKSTTFETLIGGLGTCTLTLISLALAEIQQVGEHFGLYVHPSGHRHHRVLLCTLYCLCIFH
jgi:hypothetical protein